MKIVILSSRFPFPIEKGDKLRLYHQMRGLAEEHDVHLISLTEEDLDSEYLEHVKQFCKSVDTFTISSIASRFFALKGFINHFPFQVNYFLRSSIKTKIHKLVDQIEPDVIYCQLIRMSEYAIDLEIPKLIDYMDAFSLGAKRRSEHHKYLQKWFFANESKRLYQYEYDVSNEFDGMTIISEQDRTHLIKKSLVPKEKLEIVTNGIDIDFFVPRLTQKNYDVLFVGNMGYHPNILAAKYLINEVSPLVSEKYKFQIAGTRPTSSVKALARTNVKITGWMNDIRDAYDNSRIFVAPIFSGAGQQNKILEAMSMGVPCITTSVVNEGIGAEDGINILVADSQQDFAHKIDLLLKDSDFHLKISVEGRKFVENHFSWESENKKLNLLLNKVKKIR